MPPIYLKRVDYVVSRRRNTPTLSSGEPGREK
jgi:hypothetical protein